jgi:hypothetical protein
MTSLPYFEPLFHQLSIILSIMVDGIRPIGRGVLAGGEEEIRRKESGRGAIKKDFAQPL